MRRFISAVLAFCLTLVPMSAFAAPTMKVRNNVQLGRNLTVVGSTTLQTPLGRSSVNNSVRTKVIPVFLSPNTGAAADSTVYRELVFPGKAWTLVGATAGCITAPTVGVCTIKALKGSSSGNTMLSTNTFDATSLTANTASPLTLSAISADLSGTATQGLYLEYSAGAQTVDAVGVSVTVTVLVADD